MNREIKFRAWDKSLKLMIPFTDNHICQEYSGIIFTPPHDNDWSGIGNLPGSYGQLADGIHYSEQYELMQFTGLKDKNGKEIYEGDILGLIEPEIDGQQSEFGTVEVLFGEYDDSEIEYGSSGIGWFVNGCHGYKRTDGKKDIYWIGLKNESDWSLDRCLRWEIIGNIYENPELLKKES